MSIREQKLTIEALERIDDQCAKFEKSWQTSRPPIIESMVTEKSGSAERDALLCELILLEIHYRRRHGESPTKSEYLERFPEDAELINTAFKEDDKPTGRFQPPSIEHLAGLLPKLHTIELIGVGGMGAVYKARQEGLDRMVALKLLPKEFGHDVKFALRFTREARTLAKLNHPNIVGLYEFGQVDDTYYFLMEYIEGSNLRDIVKSGDLAPDQALSIVPRLCDALQYAHDQGVVHRDIKPENILISIDGSVKIADFGLSRILDNDNAQQPLTATHQVMGTPRYMAPEQLEGAHRVDHRADIYSLGVVIYEMLTGELPIGRFAAPSTKAQIDVRLDEVVLRSLEKEPQRRYQRASQIRSDVESIATTDNPALVKTLVTGERPEHPTASVTSPTQQEIAGRLLLTRHELMRRVQQTLRPLFRGQVFQIIIGVAIIALGAQCWARNTGVPHRLVSGAVLHLYGVFLIASALAVCTRIKRIDYSKPVREIRVKLGSLQSVYLGVIPGIGFPWWLMWIPTSVALGFDEVMHPNSLWVSLFVGVMGAAVSVWLYVRALRSDSTNDNVLSTSNKMKLSGGCIKAAFRTLNEIEGANIR